MSHGDTSVYENGNYKSDGVSVGGMCCYVVWIKVNAGHKSATLVRASLFVLDDRSRFS